MKKKKSFITLAVAVIGSLFLFVGCKGDHSQGYFAVDYISETLELTDKQESKLETIREEIKAETKRLHKDKKHLFSTLMEQLSSDTIDKNVITQVVTEHLDKLDPIITLTIDRLTDFHADLTPEQKVKLVAKLEKFKERRKGCFMK